MMKTSYPALAVLATLLSAACISADDKPATENKLAIFERFAGEWTVEGKWSDGSGLRARNVYAWSLGKKIMTSKTFVKDGDREYQRYEGVLAWHPEKKSLYQVSFAFDGSMTENLMEAKDKDTLHIAFASFAKDKPSMIRQTIHFVDDDSYQWVVSRKVGDKWVQLIDATWKRKAK
jgi:hypothetical protein